MMSSSGNPQEIDHLRGRVRLYLAVMFTVDVFAYVTDVLTPLALTDLEPVEMSTVATAVRAWCTVLVIGGLGYTTFARPRRTVLTVFESAVTISLVLSYIQVGLGSFDGGQIVFGPIFTMFGIMLILVVRASLVPSRVSQTLVIGVGSIVCWLVFWLDTLSQCPQVALDGTMFIGVAFVVATSVTSHVIYGLRAQVRQALRLGQYELGRKLGEGGMGEVYKATHVLLRRPTAVKLLPIDKAGEKTVARFEREVRQTSRLEHPNSVTIYDYGHTPDGQFYYAMEYFDGLTLEELVALDGPLNEARAAAILLQVAHALAEAHAMGLIHRDVKPANIMLCDRGQVPDTVKVLDFGLVKVMDDPEPDTNITQANTVVGTPHFLAPESISTPDNVGPASDIYALGAVGFYLVTGREVFTGRSAIEVCSHHLSAEPQTPSEVLGEPIDADFENLILRCLAKDPEERHQDGRAFAEKLDQLEFRGWTQEDARRWWDRHRSSQAGVSDQQPTHPTQLAIDVNELS